MPDQSTEIPRESCLATNFDPDKRPRERVYVGKLESVGGEMWAHALLMPHGAMFAQPVADRIAQTLRALTDIDERGDDGKWTVQFRRDSTRCWTDRAGAPSATTRSRTNSRCRLALDLIAHSLFPRSRSDARPTAG